MAIKNPTNNDLMKVLQLHYDEYINRFNVIEDQVKKTNGRVTILESRNAVADGVEAYKMIHNEKLPLLKSWYDNTKLVGAVVFLITALATIITIRAGL